MLAGTHFAFAPAQIRICRWNRPEHPRRTGPCLRSAGRRGALRRRLAGWRGGAPSARAEAGRM